MWYKVANLVNERPIRRHPTSPDDATYLCPNDLLLGRATSQVPNGPFREPSNPRQQFEFVLNVVNYLEETVKELLSKLTNSVKVAHSSTQSQGRHFLGKTEEKGEYKYSTRIPNRGKPSVNITEEAILPLTKISTPPSHLGDESKAITHADVVMPDTVIAVEQA
ncbi:hypothetical protein P5673_003572 [Acropora cervicornis]|uniref:Uncharacterized protein n=1 Tax=Acropora cervicornis TaxID=6130 RepID=A0AAD9R0T9_ACRCE|nr:hypothetical protein P5673_003572 [Acropora cervicornis]